MSAVTRTAGSADEAQAIVRAISEGRAHITHRPAAVLQAVAAPVLAAVAPARSPVRRAYGSMTGAIRIAAEHLIALGEPFSGAQIREVLGLAELEHSSIALVMAGLLMEGKVIELDRHDARRRPATNGRDLYAKQWLPVRP